MKKQRLQELAGIKEADLGLRQPNDPEPLSAIMDDIGGMPNQGVAKSGTVAQSLEDGYYALADNLPGLIKDLEDVAKLVKGDPRTQSENLMAIQNEVRIYKDIQTLLDQSALGKLL